VGAIAVMSLDRGSTQPAVGKTEVAGSMATHKLGEVWARSAVVDLGKAGTISTGICFLNHMVDQLTSHAQLGVTLEVSLDSGSTWLPPDQDYIGNLQDVRPHDPAIFAASGAALGAALKLLLDGIKRGDECKEPHANAAAEFCCPLDEAFTECCLDLLADQPSCEVALSPYGTMPVGGRKWIGSYRCELTPSFWTGLVDTLGCRLRLRKVRGKNAHHIVEATFKSFARCFRACLDRLQRVEGFGPGSAAARPRAAAKSRSTNETSIDVSVDLDDPCKGACSTGNPVVDRLLSELTVAAKFQINIKCCGDLYIDDHHTAEDVSITLGQCINSALGERKGVRRMGCAVGTSGGARVRVVMDLSNRPHFECDLTLDEEFVGGSTVAQAARAWAEQDLCLVLGKGDSRVQCGSVLSCEMLLHLFDSLTCNARVTTHVEQLESSNAPGHTLHLAIATARAFGACLFECSRVEPRRAGQVASSKGSLSI